MSYRFAAASRGEQALSVGADLLAAWLDVRRADASGIYLGGTAILVAFDF